MPAAKPAAAKSGPATAPVGPPAKPAHAVLPPRPGNVGSPVIPAPPPATTRRPPKAGKMRVAGLALLLAAVAAGTWSWINAEPSPIPGRVSFSGAENGAVEIRVFRGEDLSASWRELLGAAEVRAAELADLSQEVLARYRQAWLAYDLAARVFAVGAEYNMPDLADLGAERDGKKAGEVAVMEELNGLAAEKQGLVTLEGLLGALPAPTQTVVADAQGLFALPPPEGAGFVLLALSPSESDGRVELRGWLELLELSADGRLPGRVELSDENRLDVETIRQFVAGEVRAD